jgi:hypothetical protein
MLQDWSDFWECYIWATTSEVLGREAATGGSKGKTNWFNLNRSVPGLSCIVAILSTNILYAILMKICT